MKNALILHGTDSKPDSNWFPWLGAELEKLGYDVMVPALPNTAKPSLQDNKNFVLDSGFKFEEETIIIGHSSGAVLALGILEELDQPISIAIMVGSFRGDLGWDNLKGMSEEPNYSKVSGKANEIIFVHSDNDPYCPLEHAKYQAEQTGGKLVVLEGQGHFSYESDSRFKELPELLDLVQ